MFNFLTFLGWNPGTEQEIFTKNELINIFNINKIQKSGAKWNDKKLNWMNKEYLKEISLDRLEENIFKWLPKELKIKKIIPIIVERISKFSDIKEMINNGELDFFYKQPKLDAGKLIYKNSSNKQIIKNLKEVVSNLEFLNSNDFNKKKIKDILIELSVKKENAGEVLHPIRYALSGLDKSPDPFILSEILGKKETINRLNNAIKILKI